MRANTRKTKRWLVNRQWVINWHALQGKLLERGILGDNPHSVIDALVITRLTTWWCCRKFAIVVGAATCTIKRIGYLTGWALLEMPQLANMLHFCSSQSELLLCIPMSLTREAGRIERPGNRPSHALPLYMKFRIQYRNNMSFIK